MIPVKVVALVSLLYFALLFVVAYYADQKRDRGQSIISNPHIYSLSLAVYCTSWTFYGSVGRAATVGLDFLAIYLGPTLIAFSWWLLLRKMVRISKEQNIVSIADFIASRYGKSTTLGAIVTIFAVLGIMPHIALELKAVSHTFDLLVAAPKEMGFGVKELIPTLPAHIDTALIVTLVLGLFGVLFGARHLDASERHEGLVAAIALESLVKLVAFVAVGLFVTYGLFDGFTDIFTRFLAEYPERKYLLLLDTPHVSYGTWFTLTFISMMAFMFIPRQFHIMVIENSSEDHIKSAMWRLPGYLFLINLFVIPIALGGLILNGGDTSNADYFVLNLPLHTGHPWLAMAVFIGGFSASAGMVMVSSVALSTMVLNHLVMPVVLRLYAFQQADLSVVLINIKRLGILAVIFLGYLYFKVIGEAYALVNIGIISFIAATQFAPALIGGLYWKRASQRGAAVGMTLGFIIWFYTLLIPAFIRSGWMESDILEKGLFGFSFLRPLELFGLSGLNIWTHSLFWTLFFNGGVFLTLSLLFKPRPADNEEADKFVDVLAKKEERIERKRMSKPPTVMEFVDLMTKFIGEKQAHVSMADFLGNREIDERGSLSEYELPNLKRFTERTLAGSVGAAPARIIIDNYLATRGSKMEDVFDIFGSVTISRKASREQLGVLYEAAAAVASGVDLQAVLDNILDLLTQQFKFELSAIRFLDEGKMVLTVKSQKGMASDNLKELDRELSTGTYIGEAFLTNSVKVVNDTDFMDKPDSARIIHREGIKAFAHAPITIEGQPIGVLSAFSRSAKGIFSDEFIELYRSLAGQIGVAWRNARQTNRLIKAGKQEEVLQIAKTIQSRLIPETTPEMEGVLLAGKYVPANEVGGDYYDFWKLDENTLDLVIADVSGHDYVSATMMTVLRTMIRNTVRWIPSIPDILSYINLFLHEDLERAELHISMVFLRYDCINKTITYAKAGHQTPPLLWRENKGESFFLDIDDLDGNIFGLTRVSSYNEAKIKINNGDFILLCTDGITEMENMNGDFFGEDGLAYAINKNMPLPPSKILDQLLNEVRTFSGTEAFNDDVALVGMRLTK